MDIDRRANEQFNRFAADCGVDASDLSGKKILELGFGNGLFLKQCQKAGMIVAGLEVRPPVYEKTSTLFPEMDLKLYDGLNIPFDDESFDYIVSFQVLEHVESIERFISESLRVLKHDGRMCHKFPNYKSFYEGHYKLIWLPFLNKSSGRIYLKMLGKYTDYYESLNIIKPADIRSICRNNSDKMELISDGKKEFAGKFTIAEASKIKNRFLRKTVTAICRVEPLRKIMLSALSSLGMYYPLMISARKK